MDLRSARSFGSSSQSLCSGFLEAKPGGGGSSACNRSESQTGDRAAENYKANVAYKQLTGALGMQQKG